MVTPRYSTCKTKGTLNSKRFQDKIYGPNGDQAFLATLSVPTRSENDSSCYYIADLNTDYDTGIIKCSDLWSFLYKTRRQFDPYNTSYNEYTAGPHAWEYKISMQK